MNPQEIIQAGPGEKAKYMVHDFNDNTIRFVLCYDGKICAETLQKAAAALVESVDILHSTFVMGKLNAYWHVNEDYNTEDYFSYSEITGNILNAAAEDAMLPIRPDGKVQLHCTLIRDEKKSAVSFRVSHLCVDGSDGKYLLCKLTEAYNRILHAGSAQGLAVKDGNRAPEQVYENLSKEEMHSLISNPMSGVKTGFPFPTEEPGRKHMVWKIIPRNVMEAARLRAKEKNATVNDILLTACYRGYAALPETDANMPLCIQSFMDLRKHCRDGESEGLCNLSGSLSTTLMEGVNGTFSDTLMQVAEQTRAAKENPLAGLEGMPILHSVTRAMPLSVLLKIAAKLYGSFSMGLTNVGNLDEKVLKMGECSTEMGIFGGPMKKKPGVQICTASFGGVTALCVVGEFTDEDAERLQELLELMAAEIKGFADA